MGGSCKGHIFGLRGRTSDTVLELDAPRDGTTVHHGGEASAGSTVDADGEGVVLSKNKEVGTHSANESEALILLAKKCSG